MKIKNVDLSHWIGDRQLSVLKTNCRGEEGEFFKNKIAEVVKTILTMPHTYQTEGQGDEAKASMHYFNGGSDWWIVEKDVGDPEDPVKGVQCQAFGLALVNGDREMSEVGYINIGELIENHVELDLYWTPKTLREVKEEYRI